MAKLIEGKPNAQGLKLGIVVSRFNNFVTEKLLAGALDAIDSHGGNADEVVVARVPGAFEIPLIAKKMAASGKYDALVCLGAVIRGDTPHFDYVCEAVTRELGKVVWQFELPVGFGVLTTDNVQQALDRAGTKDANKGYEAALTAIEMVDGLRQLPR
ncbi:MAG: 6,7-dimethyl-8-ribityllumazine synthase [Deltaproteobacteria bacterium]|nr:6,7-dimethyl-8-ribityllumazine synthase [Deltaproteobacteria bacterium]